MVTASYSRIAFPVLLLNDGPTKVATVQCNRCGVSGEWRLNQRSPPAEMLPKHFANKGWHLASRSICPACQRKPKMSKLTVAPPKAEPPEDPERARKLKKLVYMALMDYYDEDRKAYKSGYSDKTVAESCEASEVFVKKIREDDFGPLGPPDEVQAMRNEIAKLLDEVSTVSHKIDQLCVRNGWKT